MFQGFIHVNESGFPRIYSLSWKKEGIISFKINSIVVDDLKGTKRLSSYGFKEFGFKRFCDNINEGEYGFDGCAKVNHLKDGSVELNFKLEAIGEDNKGLLYLFACAATWQILFNVFHNIPEKEIKNSLPQFIVLGTACCKNKMGGHGATIGGEISRDVKEYLSWHYVNKGEKLKEVFSALIKAASILNNKRANPNYYWAEVRGESGFLSIDCIGNSCGLNTEEVYTINKNQKDLGADLVPHNIDSIFQQTVLIAALAALSDETEKHYLERNRG